MTSGLTFNADDVSVKGTDTTLAKDTDYTYSRNENGFELNIYVLKLQAYKSKDIVVTYSAVVNSSAVAKIETNKAQIEYSINPVAPTETVKSGEYKEAVYSSKIVVDKYKAGDEATKLSGAEFYLYKNLNGSKKYYQVNSSDGVVSWVDTQNTATKKRTNTSGAASFDGIADGTYYLEEVKAPDGYNKLAEDEKVIVNGGGENPVEAKLTVTKSIENHAGAKLPESGSAGLSMYFIIGGGIILMCSLLLIVFRIRPSRKR